jgi:hypothetical protein
MKPDFSDPAAVVRAFIHQMHYWEGLAGSLRGAAQARHNPGNDSTMHPEEVRVSDLTRQIPPVIAATYLTRRKGPAPAASYSVPPQYDPATEKVVRVVPKTKSQVVVETDRKAAYMGGLRQYALKLEDGRWLIDSITVTIGTQKMKITIL